MTTAPLPAHAAPEMTPQEARVLREAQRWLGTPWHHQASRCGVGTDCLGLARGIWRALYGREPYGLPSYPRTVPAGSAEVILDLAGRYLQPVPQPRARVSARPGQLLVFRMHRDFPARHLAILSAPTRMIHALSDRAVMETGFSAWWQKRCVAVYAFPPSLEKDMP